MTLPQMETVTLEVDLGECAKEVEDIVVRYGAAVCLYLQEPLRDDEMMQLRSVAPRVIWYMVVPLPEDGKDEQKPVRLFAGWDPISATGKVFDRPIIKAVL